MELVTNRLKIIPCTHQSLDGSTASDFEIGPHIKPYLDQIETDPSLLGWGVWLVVHKDTKEIIGDLGFKGKPNEEKTVEIGYGMAHSAQGNGYATEAVLELLKWAFSHETVEKIIAECLVDNYASIRVLQKLNMRRVSVLDGMINWELVK